MSGFLCSMVGVSFISAPTADTYIVPTAGFTDDLNTKILLKFDGNNNDTIGSGRTANTISTSGSPARSNTIFKYGSESMQIPASASTTSTVYANNASDWDMFVRDFTVEYWAYVPSFTDMTYPFSAGLSKMIGNTNSPFNGNDWGWSFGFLNDGTLRLFYYSGSYRSVASTTTFATNTWHHLVCEHRNSDGRIRIGANGVWLATATKIAPGFTNPFLTIGTVRLNSPNFYIDEVRVSHSLRYSTTTTSFTNSLFNWNQYHINQLAYAGLDSTGRPVFGFSTKDLTSTYPTFTLFRVNSDLTITQGSKNTITSVDVVNAPVAAIDTDNNYGYCTYAKTSGGMFAKTFTIDKDNLSIGTAGTEATIFPTTDAGFCSSSYLGNGRVMHWHRRGGQVSAMKYTTRSGTTLTVSTNEIADGLGNGDVYHEIRAFDRSADLYRVMHVGKNNNPQARASYFNDTSASIASSETTFSWSLGGGINHRNIVRLKAADKFMIFAKGATTAQVAAGTVTWPGSGTGAPTIAQGAVLTLTDLPNGNLYGAVDGFANDEAYIVYKKNSDSLFYWRKITASTNTLTEGSANVVSIGSASTTGALILSSAQAFSKKLIVAVADNSGSSSPDILVMDVT